MQPPRTGSYETRHAGHACLGTHRHARAYAALVVDGAYVEPCLEGPMACAPGTLLLHPRFHAHGNRFERQGARVANLDLPDAYPGQALVALTVPDLRDARRVFAHADLDALRALVVASRPVAGGDTLPWQTAMLAALRDTELPVARIAADLGVSAAHASRAMRQAFGMGPLALRRELRWRHALELLRGEAPLAVVAASAGFADQSHLTRVARAHSGFTPARLRRQINSGQDPGHPAMLQSA